MCPTLLVQHHSAELVECLPIDINTWRCIIQYAQACFTLSRKRASCMSSIYMQVQSRLEHAYIHCLSNQSYLVLQDGLQCSELEGQSVWLWRYLRRQFQYQPTFQSKPTKIQHQQGLRSHDSFQSLWRNRGMRGEVSLFRKRWNMYSDPRYWMQKHFFHFKTSRLKWLKCFVATDAWLFISCLNLHDISG